MAGVANANLLREYFESSELKVDSPAFLAHEKQVDGLKLLRTLLALHYPVPDDFERFVLYAQLNQGEALKTGVTHWRSRMFRTSGCLHLATQRLLRSPQSPTPLTPGKLKLIFHFIM